MPINRCDKPLRYIYRHRSNNNNNIVIIIILITTNVIVRDKKICVIHVVVCVSRCVCVE